MRPLSAVCDWFTALTSHGMTRKGDAYSSYSMRGSRSFNEIYKHDKRDNICSKSVEGEVSWEKFFPKDEESMAFSFSKSWLLYGVLLIICSITLCSASGTCIYNYS